MNKINIILLLMILPITAWSYDKDRAISNFSHELVECSTYLRISSEAIKKVGNASLANEYIKQSNAFLSMSSKFSKQETIVARMELAVNEQMNIIDYDFSNMSILINKYAEKCKEISNQPEVRLGYWLEK